MSSLVAILGTSTSSKDLHGALWLASQESNRARACAPAALGHLHNGPRTLAALEVLKAAGPDKAFLEPLRKYLHDNAIEYGTVDEGGIEYELAASILGRQGPAGVRIVLDRLADIEDYYARKLSWGLGEHLDEIFPTLLEATKSPNSGTRRRVIKLLAKTKDKKRLRAVYDAALPLALNDPDAGVREEAAHQLRWLIRDLGEIPQEETLRKAAVEHADENVRLGAMYALGEINLPTVEFLIDRLTDSAERVRVIATHGLAQHGPAAAKAVPSILERLDKGDPPSPCMGALAHIAPDDPRTVEAIVGQLAAKVPQHVQLAIRWLIYLGPKGRTAEKRLRDLPKADAMEDRLYRLHALWKMTDEDADRLAFVDELRPLLQRIETFETWMDARHVTWAVKELGAGARELLPSIDRALQKNINSDNRKNLSDARAAIVGAK